jgi:hypothetical protein
LPSFGESVCDAAVPTGGDTQGRRAADTVRQNPPPTSLVAGRTSKRGLKTLLSGDAEKC